MDLVQVRVLCDEASGCLQRGLSLPTLPPGQELGAGQWIFVAHSQGEPPAWSLRDGLLLQQVASERIPAEQRTPAHPP